MLSKLAKRVINSNIVVKHIRWLGYWMSAHRKLLGIEFDGEWNVWRTKAEDDAHWKRKADWAEAMGKLHNRLPSGHS